MRRTDHILLLLLPLFPSFLPPPSGSQTTYFCSRLKEVSKKREKGGGRGGGNSFLPPRSWQVGRQAGRHVRVRQSSPAGQVECARARGGFGPGPDRSWPLGGERGPRGDRSPGSHFLSPRIPSPPSLPPSLPFLPSHTCARPYIRTGGHFPFLPAGQADRQLSSAQLRTADFFGSF